MHYIYDYLNKATLFIQFFDFFMKYLLEIEQEIIYLTNKICPLCDGKNYYAHECFLKKRECQGNLNVRPRWCPLIAVVAKEKEIDK